MLPMKPYLGHVSVNMNFHNCSSIAPTPLKCFDSANRLSVHVSVSKNDSESDPKRFRLYGASVGHGRYGTMEHSAVDSVSLISSKLSHFAFESCLAPLVR